MLREIDHRTPDGASQVDLEARLPDYVADRPIERLRDDLLDFRGDARAVAEIICKSEPGPPLAIGLFGDWGSGKSSFMHLLHQEIEQLTGQARMHEGGTPFIRRAARVLFNAWQYNDTALWPALAENTFAQLRAGSAERLSRQLSDEVLQDLKNKVDSSQDIADGLALDLVEARHQETAKRDQLLDAEDERNSQIKSARDEAIGAVASHLAKADHNRIPTTKEKAAAAKLIDDLEDRQIAKGEVLRDLVNAVSIAWELRQKRSFIVFGLAALVLVFGGSIWLSTEWLLGLSVPLLSFVTWFLRMVQPLVV